MLFNTISDASRLFSLLIACVIAQSSVAASLESLDNITTVTKNFILKNVAVDAGDSLEIKVDAMRASAGLPACANELVAAFPANANREQITGIEISCTGTAPWHTLIPVDVQTYTQVLVAKQNILPKQEITDDLVDYGTYSKNRLYNSSFRDKTEVMGQVATMMITPGTPLTKRNIQAPVIIHRNDVVNLTATSKSVTVGMQGIAKSDGSIKAVIQVYNPSSKRIVDAVVTGHNKAEVVS